MLASNKRTVMTDDKNTKLRQILRKQHECKLNLNTSFEMLIEVLTFMKTDRPASPFGLGTAVEMFG